MEQQPTPVFLPEEFHGQRSLADYSPWGSTELDMTEQLTHTHIIHIKLKHYFLEAELLPLEEQQLSTVPWE